MTKSEHHRRFPNLLAHVPAVRSVHTLLIFFVAVLFALLSLVFPSLSDVFRIRNLYRDTPYCWPRITSPLSTRRPLSDSQRPLRPATLASDPPRQSLVNRQFSLVRSAAPIACSYNSSACRIQWRAHRALSHCSSLSSWFSRQ